MSKGIRYFYIWFLTTLVSSFFPWLYTFAFSTSSHSTHFNSIVLKNVIIGQLAIQSISLPVTAFFVSIFGIPTYIVLHRGKLFNWGCCTLAGAIIGCISSEIFLGHAHSFSADDLRLFTLAGALGGLTAWAASKFPTKAK